MVEAMDGIAAIAMNAGRHGWDMFNFAYRRTDVARNMMAEHLLAGPYDWLVMLDSDHRHAPETVEQLAAVMMVHPEIRILAGLNFRRGAPFEPMAYRLAEDGKSLTPLALWQAGLVEVDAVGTPILAVHREVFAAMPAPWFQYTYTAYRAGVSGSEDIAFCRRVKAETDYKIYVHTQITSPHLITSQVDEADYRAWIAAHTEVEKEQAG